MNLLIGAISGNYLISDIKVWVESSNFDNVKRVLLLYNNFNKETIDYLKSQDIEVLKPDYDFWGQEKNYFETNTGKVTLENSYDLVHNIRFFHIWGYLNENKYEKVIITDVKDVYFTSNPFNDLVENKITATSEIITYNNHQWNKEHLFITLGTVGYNTLFDKQVLNVGVFGGDYELVKNICSDIYLIAAGKAKVADQTSFNYLINTKYKDLSVITTNIAVHLHVINEGLVDFDFSTLQNYKIIHQYDRIEWLKRQIFSNYSL